MLHNKTCIVIAGPTAVGKTSLAIEWAKSLHTAIISADSRQCFKELNIGVAKPSTAQLLVVPHYFINSHSITEEVNAGVFEQYALQKAEELFKAHDTIVMVGGTGLYIKAFCEGIDVLPVVDPVIRQHIINEYKQNGLKWLQQQVAQQDPVYYAKGEIKNPQRLMRALEVILSSGESITHFQTQQKKQRNFKIIKIGLELPKEELIQNINVRVQTMMEEGLLEEVKQLLPYRKYNALQTVGYKEIFDYLDGICSLDAAVEQIQINTRQYAKRQMTWFKKDTEFTWLSPKSPLPALQAGF
jgi:tRNA dimethylallyltransferase